MIVFGPVPSRRLGRSVGINNIPPKSCTFSCVYCQLGSSAGKQVKRCRFYDPQDIYQEVQDKLEKIKAHFETVDYLTFVPDGEPTLDACLGHAIDLLKPVGIDIAVITNASLIWREDVRADLMAADWVSLKVDAVDATVWRRINRPHPRLDLDAILNGMIAFSQVFTGKLMVETMLVKGINDADEHMELLAAFLGRLNPLKAYCAIPTRPPAEKWASAPSEETINRAYQILSRQINRVELLIGYEGSDFGFTGDVVEDMLGITAVHPMREDAVDEFLARAGADWSVVRRLVDQRQLIETKYEGNRFYLRKFRSSVA